MKTKPIASVTVYNAARMTPAGRKTIAEFLKRAATDLVRFGEQYASCHIARYMGNGK